MVFPDLTLHIRITSNREKDSPDIDTVNLTVLHQDSALSLSES